VKHHRLRNIVLCVLTYNGLALSPLAAPSDATSGEQFDFVAFGYVCLHSGRESVRGAALLVDTPSQPICAESVGIGLGRIPKRFRFTTTPQGTWFVSRTPLQISGAFRRGKAPTFKTVRVANSRRDRLAESLATVESGAFTELPTPPKSRSQVFALLPEFAEIAPNATVRVGRAFRNGTYTYGADVRDPNMTNAEREATLGVSRRLGIGVATNLTRRDALEPTCVPPTTTGEQLLGWPLGTVTTPRWTRSVDLWATRATTCDEPTQVAVIQAPIVATIEPLPVTLDTVIDSTIRVTRVLR
jgi:hypothetical protein